MFEPLNIAPAAIRSVSKALKLWSRSVSCTVLRGVLVSRSACHNLGTPLSWGEGTHLFWISRIVEQRKLYRGSPIRALTSKVLTENLRCMHAWTRDEHRQKLAKHNDLSRISVSARSVQASSLFDDISLLLCLVSRQEATSTLCLIENKSEVHVARPDGAEAVAFCCWKKEVVCSILGGMLAECKKENRKKRTDTLVYRALEHWFS